MNQLEKAGISWDEIDKLTANLKRTLGNNKTSVVRTIKWYGWRYEKNAGGIRAFL